MSKLAKIPVAIKEGVIVNVENGAIKVSGPKGILSFSIPEGVTIKTEGLFLRVMPNGKKEDVSAVLGLTKALLSNMIKGVSEGFEKKLELSGVGYRASISGKDLILNVGFSHPVKIAAVDGVAYSVADNVIRVLGMDKALVGDTAAKIRKVKLPDPYKEKGIKYVGEKVRRKVGKAAKAIGTK